jgi:transcription elongation factor GreB
MRAREKRSGFITPEGERTLRKELVFLWHEERPRVVKGVADAAAEGDRSENAEYIYGKKRLREIDRRIKYLSERLDAVTVVEIDPARSPERVVFGAYVDVIDEDGNEKTLRIVGPDEFDGEKNFISMDSPIGKALMKKREGDVVHVVRPMGDVELEIVGIRFTPEP